MKIITTELGAASGASYDIIVEKKKAEVKLMLLTDKDFREHLYEKYDL